MANLGRPSTWDQYADEMVQLYEHERLSRGEIALRFGTSVQTITRVLTRQGVIFEDRMRNPNAGRSPERQAEINAKVSATLRGRARGPYKTPEMRTCEECGNEYEYRAGRAGERFCSRQCRTDYLKRLNQAEARADYEAHPKMCPCGKSVPYEFRHTRQFCSPECRGEYQAKRTKNPGNYITFNCLNCGKEVHRLKKYGSGASKYCSNECSAKHNRAVQHIVIENAVILDSGYEALFWGLCRFLKIPAERADRQQAIPFGEGGWYCPDFYLPSIDMWVEVKGLADDDDLARVAAWRKAGHRLAFVEEGALEALRRMNATETKTYMMEIAGIATGN